MTQIIVARLACFALCCGLVAPSLAEDLLQQTGAQLYASRCSSCHGSTGKGDGPVAESLKNKVPDLTALTKRFGKFPTDRVEQTIDGRHVIGAHGTRDMPVWGETFARSEIGNPDAERVTQAVIKKLVEYVRSIQRPAEAR